MQKLEFPQQNMAYIGGYLAQFGWGRFATNMVTATIFGCHLAGSKAIVANAVGAALVMIAVYDLLQEKALE